MSSASVPDDDCSSVAPGEQQDGAVTVYFLDQGETLACALRGALERVSSEEDFVSCARMHPLDTHVEVHAPSVAVVRRALVELKQECARLRHDTVIRRVAVH